MSDPAPEDEDYYSDSGEDYDNDTEDEGASSYRRGGYHPVHIGDVYNNRYTIEKKLGWGHFSTVWLASDAKKTRTEKNYLVALKIQKSASQYTEAARDEIELLTQIKNNNTDGSGDCVVQLLDHFFIVGPNGRHMCLAFETMGRNLLSLIKQHDYQGVPFNMVRCITKQCLLGLDFLHTKCNIIHTDLKPENFLLAPETDFDIDTIQVTRRYIMEAREARDKENPPASAAARPVEPVLSKETLRRIKQEVKEIQEKRAEQDAKDTSATDSDEKKVDELTEKMEELDLNTTIGRKGKKIPLRGLLKSQLADLGNACWTHKHFTDDVTTRQYRSPEVIVGYQYGTPVDVWSVACLVFELITGDFLFDPKEDKNGNHTRDEDHLALMLELVGQMPRNLYTSGRYSKEMFTRRGVLRNITHLEYWGLQAVLHEKYKVPTDEAIALCSFLTPMLRLDPSKRATAAEALQHPWLLERQKDPEDPDYEGSEIQHLLPENQVQADPEKRPHPEGILEGDDGDAETF